MRSKYLENTSNFLFFSFFVRCLCIDRRVIIKASSYFRLCFFAEFFWFLGIIIIIFQPHFNDFFFIVFSCFCFVFFFIVRYFSCFSCIRFAFQSEPSKILENYVVVLVSVTRCSFTEKIRENM